MNPSTLGIPPLGHELDTAIRDVADKSRNLESPSERLACEAKPHPLDPAGEVDSTTIPTHDRQPRARPDRADTDSNTASKQTVTTFQVIS